jgi:hypothetical protein
MWQIFKNFLHNFFGALLGRKLPEDNKNENVIVLHDLREKLNDFRMNNGLLPYFYNNFLEEIAQSKANENYFRAKADDDFSKTSIQIRLRMHGISADEINFLSVRSTNGAEGFFREIVANQKYRGAILNGFLNSLGIAKCENYICIILTD